MIIAAMDPVPTTGATASGPTHPDVDGYRPHDEPEIGIRRPLDC
jgi:hypothetical protein